jgi:predicted acylesterase/phospholipase RssA
MSSADTSRNKRDQQNQAAQASEQGRNQPKRAICLAGGGPVAGLQIGALHALKQHGIDFHGEDDVWALSCIGAWVGIVYNQFEKGDRAQQAYEFFRDNVYRDDETYESFPINRIFGPDWFGNAEALKDFLLDPVHYRKLFSARSMMESAADTLSKLSLYRQGRKWNEGNFNGWVLNDVMAVSPLVRFMTSMMYKSKITGLTKLNYPGSDFLKKIKFDNLYEDPEKEKKDKGYRKPPYMFHNAWNLSQQKLKLFCNDMSSQFKDDDGEPYRPITPATLCACSALPYIEQTVEIDGDVYCEGALIDTVNFKHLLKDHGKKLNEVWICRIVDAKQIRKPENLYDSLANLCELFASTVGEDDVALFKNHVRQNNRQRNHLAWKGIIVEIRTATDVNYEWSHRNLKRGCESGARAANEAYMLYEAYKHREPKDGVLMIPDDLTDKDFTNLNLKPPARDNMERIVHVA